jgi:antitoxin component of RelBE/YafQ-DinJ toxin-antitoxin module
MIVQPKDTKITVRIDNDLLALTKQRCREEDVTLSFVIRTALQDFVRYGMEVRILRMPPEEEDMKAFF